MCSGRLAASWLPASGTQAGADGVQFPAEAADNRTTGLRSPSLHPWFARVFLVALCAVFGGEVRAGAALDSWLADIAQQRAASVEAAIALLPVSLRTDYVLVFSSRSLQEASLEAPRVVLYGPDARFIVTFNGDGGQRGYDAIETMEFDDRSSSFHFRELKFTSGGVAELSADNPARCAACHGRPARPVWDLPPVWPGVYGERYRAGLSESEAAGMSSFLRRQPGDPRYRFLIAPARFADRSTYVGSARARYDGDAGEPPNFRLTAHLAAMQQQSLIASLLGVAAFDRYRYLLVAAADGHCGDVAGYLPADQRAQVRAERERRVAQAAPLRIREEVERESRRVARVDSYRAGFNAIDLGELRTVAEVVVGLPPQRWALSLDNAGNDRLLVDNENGPADLLAGVVESGDAALRNARSLRTFGEDDPYCHYLRSASRRALTEGPGTAPKVTAEASASPPGPASTRPTLLGRCAACHTGEIGPQLPFDDAPLLRQALQKGGYPRGRLLDEILYRLTPAAGQERMPRGIMTSAAEQAALEDYFLGIAAAERADTRTEATGPARP